MGFYGTIGGAVVVGDNAELLDEPLQGLGIGEVLVLHDEMDGATTQVADGAVPGVVGDLEPHRGMVVVVEETAALAVLAALAVVGDSEFFGYVEY